MNKKVSNKIVYLNFILAFLILNLHSAYMELFDSQSDLVIFDYYVVYNGDSKKAYRGEIQENYFTSDGAMREFLKGGAIGINLFDNGNLFI